MRCRAGFGARDLGVPGLGETLSGYAGRFEIMHTHVGKRARRKVKTDGGWEDVLAEEMEGFGERGDAEG